MADATNILNNTILIPYHDSLVKSNELEKFSPASLYKNTGDINTDHDNNYSLYIRVDEKTSVKFIAIQEISGFGMDRANEQKIGVNPEYVINLPGPITYRDIRIKHLFTKDKFFLDWVTNGITLGGVSRCDIEIHITPIPGKDLIFTLYDAFPVRWNLSKLDPSDKDTAVYEEVTLTYSSVSFKC